MRNHIDEYQGNYSLPSEYGSPAPSHRPPRCSTSNKVTRGSNKHQQTSRQDIGTKALLRSITDSLPLPFPRAMNGTV